MRRPVVVHVWKQIPAPVGSSEWTKSHRPVRGLRLPGLERVDKRFSQDSVAPSQQRRPELARRPGVLRFRPAPVPVVESGLVTADDQFAICCGRGTPCAVSLAGRQNHIVSIPAR